MRIYAWKFFDPTGRLLLLDGRLLAATWMQAVEVWEKRDPWGFGTLKAMGYRLEVA